MHEKHYHYISKVEHHNWWYVSRRQLLCSLLPPFRRILDVGCGGGLELEALRICNQNTFAVGLDMSFDVLLRARKQTSCFFVCGSATSLPFKNQAFDAVICCDVLEHIKYDGAVLSSLSTLLAARGVLLVNVPANPILWNSIDVLSRHYRRYSLEGLRNKLESSGFFVERITYWNTILFPAIFMYIMLRRILPRFLLRKKQRLGDVPPIINSLLCMILRFERSILLRKSLPVGTSVIAVASKFINTPCR